MEHTLKQIIEDMKKDKERICYGQDNENKCSKECKYSNAYCYVIDFFDKDVFLNDVIETANILYGLNYNKVLETTRLIDVLREVPTIDFEYTPKSTILEKVTLEQLIEISRGVVPNYITPISLGLYNCFLDLAYYYGKDKNYLAYVCLTKEMRKLVNELDSHKGMKNNDSN